eukprot:2702768-Pleurochrysis_carterae.AAC.1
MHSHVPSTPTSTHAVATHARTLTPLPTPHPHLPRPTPHLAGLLPFSSVGDLHPSRAEVAWHAGARRAAVARHTHVRIVSSLMLPRTPIRPHARLLPTPS